jgi:hypothetical protein
MRRSRVAVHAERLAKVYGRPVTPRDAFSEAAIARGEKRAMRTLTRW